MAVGRIKPIYDDEKNLILPQTHEDAIVMRNGRSLSETLKNLGSGGSSEDVSQLKKKIAFLIAELPSTPATYTLETENTEWKSFEFDSSYEAIPSVFGTVEKEGRVENLTIKSVTKKGFIYRNPFAGSVKIKVEEE